MLSASWYSTSEARIFRTKLSREQKYTCFNNFMIPVYSIANYLKLSYLSIISFLTNLLIIDHLCMVGCTSVNNFYIPHIVSYSVILVGPWSSLVYSISIYSQPLTQLTKSLFINWTYLSIFGWTNIHQHISSTAY